MMDPNVNKREFTRVAVGIRTMIKAGDGEPFPVTARNVSLKGMAVVTEERLPVGSPCDIIIQLLEGIAEIQLQGKVVVWFPDGMGFEFDRILGAESFEHLRNLVRYNAGGVVDTVESEFISHSGIRRFEEDPSVRDL